MYKIKEKIKLKIWVWRVLLYFSCIIIFGCLLFVVFNMATKLSVNKEVEASYIEQKYKNKDEYKPIYHYIVDGKEYECESTFEVKTDEVESGIVHYNSSNPKTCMTDYSYDHYSKNYLYLIPIPIFIIFLVLSLMKISRQKKRKKLINILLEKGVLVKGVPYTTEMHHGAPDDLDQIVLVCDYKFPDGKTRTLKSEPFYYVNLRKSSIDILYDPDNYDNYYVGADIKKIK